MAKMPIAGLSLTFAKERGARGDTHVGRDTGEMKVQFDPFLSRNTGHGATVTRIVSVELEWLALGSDDER